MDDSCYPASIYSGRTKENKSGVVYNADKKTTLFAEDVTNLDDEVNAIETELGTNPKGDFDSVKDLISDNLIREITFIIDGGGAAIETGKKGHLRIPFKCEIQRVTLLADQTGSIKIDIWKDTYANFPPTDIDTICGANEPEITDGTKDEDATLTNWTKTINADDVLAFNVDSVTTIERVTISLKVKIIP
jgi:hypothetical protein